MAEGRLGTPTGPSGEERLLVWEKGPDKSCWSRGENYLVKNTNKYEPFYRCELWANRIRAREKAASKNIYRPITRKPLVEVVVTKMFTHKDTFTLKGSVIRNTSQCLILKLRINSKLKELQNNHTIKVYNLHYFIFQCTNYDIVKIVWYKLR